MAKEGDLVSQFAASNSNGWPGHTDLDFAMALFNRGFAAFPRLLIDYAVEMDLDYDSLGKLLVLLSELGGSDVLQAVHMELEAKTMGAGYYQVRRLVYDLAERDLVMFDEPRGGEDRLVLSFAPLFSRLAAVWKHDQEHRALERGTPFTPAPNPQGDHQAVVRYAEERLGRPLSEREISSILEWLQTYGFQEDLARAVIDEGCSNGVPRFAYLNRIAASWHEEGVRTLEDLQATQTEYRRAMVKHNMVARYLGLGRRLSEAEQKLVNKWVEEWGFPDDVILRACDTTVNIKEPNLRYIDRVLEGGHAQGIKTGAEAEALLRQRHLGPKTAPSRRAAAARTTGAAAAPRRQVDKSLFQEYLKRHGK
jgi:DnaD/phage-associated family protein